MPQLHVTFFIEDREAEIGGLERRVLVLIQEQEVLRLEIPMNNPHGMTRVHNLHDRPQQRGGCAFGVMPLGDDPVEELPTRAQLHDQMHRVLVLVRTLELDNVGLAGEVVHYLDLPPHVLDVLLIRQLPLRDRLAREVLAGLLVGAEMGHPELSSPQLLPHGVGGFYVFHRAPEDRADWGGFGWLGGGAWGGVGWRSWRSGGGVVCCFCGGGGGGGVHWSFLGCAAGAAATHWMGMDWFLGRGRGRETAVESG